jgi:hypothetical protein
MIDNSIMLLFVADLQLLLLCHKSLTMVGSCTEIIWGTDGKTIKNITECTASFRLGFVSISQFRPYLSALGARTPVWEPTVYQRQSQLVLWEGIIDTSKLSILIPPCTHSSNDGQECSFHSIDPLFTDKLNIFFDSSM